MRQAYLQIVVGLLAFGAVAFACGCDDAETPDASAGKGGAADRSPAGRAARAFMEAVQYRDVEGAWKRHVESTRGGVYCRSESFREILKRTNEAKTEKDCEDVREIGPRRRAAMEVDAEFLVQVLRFVCEQPEGDCVDYARKVFETQVPESTFWSRARQYELQKVRIEGKTANVYVDYWSGGADAGGVHRRSLEMVRRKGSWYVAETFGTNRQTP